MTSSILLVLVSILAFGNAAFQSKNPSQIKPRGANAFSFKTPFHPASQVAESSTTALNLMEAPVELKDVIVPVTFYLAAVFFTIQTGGKWTLDFIKTEDEKVDAAPAPSKPAPVSEKKPTAPAPTPVADEPAPAPASKSAPVSEKKPAVPAPTPASKSAPAPSKPAPVSEKKPTAPAPTPVAEELSGEEKKSKRSKVLSLVKALYFPWLGMINGRFK